MVFSSENDFENSFIELLNKWGWDSDVIEYPTERTLIDNWAEILFNNNRHIDKLNDYPLTDGEMQQILEQIETLKTPLRLNGMINGGSIAITRDNPDDKAHFGKEVSLKIYDRREIAAGQSRYQIARQPRFRVSDEVYPKRRGDVMLLINGMPVIHIELKRSGVEVSQACNQIQKYSKEGVFTGIFSLVQVFVAMNPEQTVYFANPGSYDRFNPDFYFHWADYNNEPINEWNKVTEALLSIPMAHQMIGFYTVADTSDCILKVMRSYQYYAASKISDTVSKAKWDGHDTLGGYVWHTTGSGKTMTSFKSAQLIANSQYADKVIFLMDRIELGVQSLKEYKSFADDSETVQDTEDTEVLVTKLKSGDPSCTLIVTSIQKMSRIREEANKQADIDLIVSKKIVFIVDEAHRSTFGDMLITIKKTFPKAIFFGFTGTPIQDENKKNDNTTAMVFGNEIHRYSIADGIRDKNVLGFDPYKVMIYDDNLIRKSVALDKAKATSEQDVIDHPEKQDTYYRYMNQALVPMAGYTDDLNNYVRGIEDYIPNSQYDDKYKRQVVEAIERSWLSISRGKFHAILATASIPEAIAYYRILTECNNIKVTALFDPNIDNVGGQKSLDKEDGLAQILNDYNAMYDQHFSMSNYADFKKDVAARLAHKSPYTNIDGDKSKQLDLLIVVNQMLTGFDSKWINALYIDKLMEYESIIQAFSRTNRLFGREKPFGTIKYFRKPNTMEFNIEKAVKLYSGDRPYGMFVDRKPENIRAMDDIYSEMSDIFAHSGHADFDRLPENKEERGKFASLFKAFNQRLEAAKIQGFNWNDIASSKDDAADDAVPVLFDEQRYFTLALRYKELFTPEPDRDGTEKSEDVPYDIDPSLMEINTERIDANYMNMNFNKYCKMISNPGVSQEELQQTLDELHKTFASLGAEQQRYAEIFLHDIQSGDANLTEGKCFIDYVIEYAERAKQSQISRLANYLGLDAVKIANIMKLGVTSGNINEYGRYDEIKNDFDPVKAKAYFEDITQQPVPAPMVGIKVDFLLRDFILKGGYDIEEPKS